MVPENASARPAEAWKPKLPLATALVAHQQKWYFSDGH
jgi:hypothetical protein